MLIFRKLVGENNLKAAQEKSCTLNDYNDHISVILFHFSVITITNAIKSTVNLNKKLEIFMSGDYMHNPLLVKFLKVSFPNVILSMTNEVDINTDMNEEVLFALLEDKHSPENPINFGNMEGLTSVCMDKICLPS